MHTKRILVSPTVSGIWSELAPRPGRLEETIRITVAALLMTVVMLTFRMPYLFAGPYLAFILSQRETMLTRALAITSLLILVIASVLVYAVALLAWNVAWLRVSLLALVFFMGFFLMRTIAQPVILLGPLVIFSLFAYAFDTVPFPNELLNQLGWIWAIFGLLYVATFLTQWLFGAPTALEVFRTQMRRALAAAELTCLRLAFGHAPAEAAISSEESHDASARLKLLGATKVLRPDETKVPPIWWTGKAQISEKELQTCLQPIVPTTRTSVRKRSISCSAAGVRSSGWPRNSVLPPILYGPGGTELSARGT